MEDVQVAEPMGSEEALLSLGEAVEFLDTSKSTFYRLLNMQDIKGVKVGKQWRFRKADLIAYMERGPVAAAVVAGSSADLDQELEFFEMALRSEGGLEDDMQGSVQESPASKIGELADRIVGLACARGASDIHVEPSPGGLRLRYRVDGVLQEVRRLPGSLQESLIGRYKEMGQMNLIEKRLPQDGRFHSVRDAKEYDIRTGLLPSLHGESIVMRILDPSRSLVGLDRLGMAPDDLATLQAVLRKSNGMVLVTGPTGSGKTTLLYSCLAEVAGPDRKVLTAEDPVEHEITYVTQVQISSRLGVTFPVVMRSIMRHDPDVILCGELRDLDTVTLAVNGALTGHLVLCAMHAEGAPAAITRLASIGMETFAVASAVKCVVGIRLARRLCPDCARPADAGDVTTEKARRLSETGGFALPRDTVLFEAAGCDRCHGTGYAGRLALFEVLSCTPQLVSSIIAARSEEEAVRLAVEAGMTTLFAAGVRTAAEGETAIDEVIRATGVSI